MYKMNYIWFLSPYRKLYINGDTEYMYKQFTDMLTIPTETFSSKNFKINHVFM